jgi:hypothetical protein
MAKWASGRRLPGRLPHLYNRPKRWWEGRLIGAALKLVFSTRCYKVLIMSKVREVR